MPSNCTRRTATGDSCREAYSDEPQTWCEACVECEAAERELNMLRWQRFVAEVRAKQTELMERIGLKEAADGR